MAEARGRERVPSIFSMRTPPPQERKTGEKNKEMKENSWKVAK